MGATFSVQEQPKLDLLFRSSMDGYVLHNILLIATLSNSSILQNAVNGIE